MLKTARTLVLAAVATALVIPTAVMAGPLGGHGRRSHAPDGAFGPGGSGHGLRMLNRMAVLLDLTEEQEAQLEAIRETTHSRIQPLAEELRAEREAWHAQHEPGTFDEEAFRRHLESQSARHHEIAVIAAAAFNDAWQVLTPDQQAQLESWRAKMQQRHASRGGRFGGPPID